MLFGAFCIGIGFIAASFAKKVWQLYLTQGLLFGVGVGFMYLPSINILPQWFEKRRSLALAISSAGAGVGGVIFSLATDGMIDKLSLVWSLRITGIVVIVVSVAVIFLIRDRDKILRPDYTLFDFSLLRNTNACLLLTWCFLTVFGHIIILFSLSDFCRSIGLTVRQANLTTALLSVGTACGRPFLGYLSDKFGRLEVAASLTLWNAVLCFAVWIPASSLGLTIFFALAIGGTYNLFWAVRHDDRESWQYASIG